MNRKANRTVPLSWVIALLLLVLTVGGAVFAVRSFLSDPYRGIPELPAVQYVGDSLSFRGNIYQVSGKVENQLAWSEKSGRLFSFEAQSPDSPVHVAVLLPLGLESVNVQKGQSFEIKVKVADKGLLEAIQIRKS